VAFLARRSSESELMDAEDVDYAMFRGCLQDLARVNALSMGYRPTLAFLERLRRAGRFPSRPVEILDVGSGYGDVLRVVAAWAARRGVEVRLTGLDLNPWSARAAAEATPPGTPVCWVTGDALAHEGPTDVILSSLFAHHLDDALVVRFLVRMEEQAGLGWFVNDLHRHPVPALGFGPLAAALRMHPFVRHDGPASFRRAFVPGDWRRLLTKAGIEGAEVRRAFPFRLCVARARLA
jgi:SAM-dependent methyltransferase